MIHKGIETRAFINSERWLLYYKKRVGFVSIWILLIALITACGNRDLDQYEHEADTTYIVDTKEASERSGIGLAVVSAISGNTSEDGITATFTVKLNVAPSESVSIPIKSSDPTEGAVSPGSLTFTPDNWSVNQIVTVIGLDDSEVDSDKSYRIILSPMVSDDIQYNQVDPNDVSLINVDNEVAALLIGNISGNTEENGTQATFNITLNGQPNGKLVLSITSSDTGEGTVSPSRIILTPSNWNASNHIVTITGQDDSINDGDQQYSVILTVDSGSTTDTNGFASLGPDSILVTNIDNDSPGVTISAPSGNTGEDGTQATFRVELDSQPDGKVVLDVISLDMGEGTVSPSTLIFTPINWNATNHIVTITGVDDEVADGDQVNTVRLTVNSNDTTDTTGYTSLTLYTLSVTNVDNDSVGLTVSSVSGNTREEGTEATFSVKLNSKPTGNVVISVVSSDTGEGTVSPSILNFTPFNWNGSNHVVTISGVDDDNVDGNQNYTIQLTVDSGTVDSSGYASLKTFDVPVTNIDNDGIGFAISPISGNTSESGSQSRFNIKLNSQPTGDVVIKVISSNLGEGAVFPASLIISPSNWNSSDHIVQVTGVDDNIADGNQFYTIELTIDVGNTTDTSGYATLNPDYVSVINTDNDSAGFIISAISGNTWEDGTEATFTVRLSTQPVDDVTLSISSSNRNEGILAPATLTFTRENWNVDQTVTVTGVNDDLEDGTQSYTAILSAVVSNDSHYNGLDPSDVSIQNMDDDSSGFFVSTISGNTTEFGGTAFFRVRLYKKPTADVVIPISSSDTTEGTVSSSTITFTSENWDSHVMIEISGVADNLGDGDQPYSIILGSASSSDSNYNGLNPSDVSVVNIDVDAPMIINVKPQDGAVQVPLNESISITFSETMNAETLIGNGDNSHCSGNIQLSNDDFSSCVPMSGNPTVTNDGKTVLLTLASELGTDSTYKLMITTGVKDVGGGSLTEEYLSGSGFQTVGWSGSQQFGSTGNDAGKGVVVDDSGNVYVTGYMREDWGNHTNQGKTDIFLAKYSKTGVELGSYQWGGVGDDIPAGIAIDNDGFLYITGTTRTEMDGQINRGGSDVFLSKFDSNFTKLWTKLFGTSNSDMVEDIIIDNHGNILICGMISGPNGRSMEAYITKFDSDGHILLSRFYGGPASDGGTGIAVDNSDNIYMVGTTYGGMNDLGSRGEEDIFLLKTDASGTLLWVRQIGTSTMDKGKGIATDRNGNVYITGLITGNIDGETDNQIGLNTIMAKYSSTGEKQWLTVQGTPSGITTGEYIKSDEYSNLYVVGSTRAHDDSSPEMGLDGNEKIGLFDIFISKYNLSGERKWTKLFGTVDDDFPQGFTIEKKTGNFFLTGRTWGVIGQTSIGGDDAYLTKFNRNGGEINPMAP